MLSPATPVRALTGVADVSRTDLRHCPTHDVWYGKLEQCGSCRAAHSSVVRVRSPKADTHELEVRESEYREADKYLRKKGREWLEDGTAQERHVALKAFEAATKYARLAYEIRQWRLEVEHEQWLAAQKRMLAGNGD